MLSHRIRPVSEILAPHVEHLWVVRGYLAARWRNMILSDGAMELIVNLGDPEKLCAWDNPAKHTIFRQSWISGERTTSIVIDEIGYVHLVGVRLRAGGAWPFLGIPLREFTDQGEGTGSRRGNGVASKHLTFERPPNLFVVNRPYSALGQLGFF